MFEESLGAPRSDRFPDIMIPRLCYGSIVEPYPAKVKYLRHPLVIPAFAGMSENSLGDGVDLVSGGFGGRNDLDVFTFFFTHQRFTDW